MVPFIKKINIFIFQTGSHLLGGFFAISLKDVIGFRGLFFLAGGLGVARKLTLRKHTYAIYCDISQL